MRAAMCTVALALEIEVEGERAGRGQPNGHGLCGLSDLLGVYFVPADVALFWINNCQENKMASPETSTKHP